MWFKANRILWHWDTIKPTVYVVQYGAILEELVKTGNVPMRLLGFGAELHPYR